MFGIRDPEKIHSGSRILGVKKHRIPDPDKQHCSQVSLNLKDEERKNALELYLDSRLFFICFSGRYPVISDIDINIKIPQITFFCIPR
jgi:hypothetical protein